MKEMTIGRCLLRLVVLGTTGAILSMVLTPCSLAADAPKTAEKKITLRLATPAPPTVALGEIWGYLSDQINKKVGDKVHVEPYYSGSLYGERTSFQAALSGAIDIGT